MANKKTKTTNVNDVRKTVQEIGDKLNDLYVETNDVKVAQSAVQAYSVAIKAAQAQVVYKKLTGSPERIEFFEGAK
jgi:hypothetical protein